MLRRTAIFSLIILVFICSTGVWLADREVNAPFVAPGAANVRVLGMGFDERLISYNMPNPDDAWYTAVARRLRLSGWSLSDEHYRWGDTEHYVTLYTRTSQFWFVRVRERAALLGDRQAAQIKVSYDVAFWNK